MYLYICHLGFLWDFYCRSVFIYIVCKYMVFFRTIVMMSRWHIISHFCYWTIQIGLLLEYMQYIDCRICCRTYFNTHTDTCKHEYEPAGSVINQWLDLTTQWLLCIHTTILGLNIAHPVAYTCVINRNGRNRSGDWLDTPFFNDIIWKNTSVLSLTLTRSQSLSGGCHYLYGTALLQNCWGSHLKPKWQLNVISGWWVSTLGLKTMKRLLMFINCITYVLTKVTYLNTDEQHVWTVFLWSMCSVKS